MLYIGVVGRSVCYLLVLSADLCCVLYIGAVGRTVCYILVSGYLCTVRNIMMSSVDLLAVCR